MLDKLAGIAARYDEIERLMGDPEIASDYVRVGELNKERSDLQTLVDSYNYYLQQQAEQDGTGQPATRPESKSEGGDKPQPEAEGSSR